MGGKSLSSPLGNDSFMWDNMGQARNFGVNLHQSFVIGPRIKVGINTNAFTTDPQETLVVGGGVSANIFEGMGHLLTGDIKTEYLKVPINGVTQNIAPTINLAPQHIYVSDEANAYPKTPYQAHPFQTFQLKELILILIRWIPIKLSTTQLRAETFKTELSKTSTLKLMIYQVESFQILTV